MENDVVSLTREGQGEGFPKSVRCAGDEGKEGHFPIINAIGAGPRPVRFD